LKITVRSSKVAKSGTSDKGNWSLCVVVDDTTGIEYTTFDTKAVCDPGTVLEIGEADIKEGKFSFKKCEVISAPEPPPSTPAGHSSSGDGVRSAMTPDDWAKKDRMERLSIEVQSGFKGVVALASAYIEKGVDPADIDLFSAVYEHALQWADVHFLAVIGDKRLLKKAPADTSSKPIPTTVLKTQVDKDIDELWEADPNRLFKNLGELLTSCKELGFTRADIVEILHINDTDLKDLILEDAWTVITSEAEAYKKKK